MGDLNACVSNIFVEHSVTITPEQFLDVLKTDIVVDSMGTRRWFLNGELHRVDGPAIEFANGSKEWWINGERLWK